MDNVLGAVDVPCTLFSGLNTELTPSDVPEGVSPDCADVAFLPGSFQTRPGLHKIFNQGGWVYQKTYMQPNGVPLNLYLDTSGNLYREDVFSAPGVLTKIGTVSPGSYCQSVTAFGREYMAFSDGLHGFDIPRQYDGTFFDRISQDGPAAGPTSVNDYTNSVAITTGGQVTATAAISAISQVGNIVTVTTATPHGLSDNESCSVFGVPVAGYNGIQTVQTVSSPTVFSYSLTATGLGSAASGSVGAAQALIVTATAHGLNAGDTITLSGGTPFDNNVSGNPATWTVVQIVNATNFVFSLIGAPATAFGSTPILISSGTVIAGGMSATGTHGVVVMFLTRQGYLTAPSPPIYWESAGGTKVQLTGLPIGPSNVIARVIGFTGAGGDNYFTILQQVTIPQPNGLPITVPSLVINDNSSTSAILDFSDTALFGATGIDIPGNNLFAQVVLGPCLGMANYAGRLITYGEYNKVENLLNLGFDGGYKGTFGSVGPLGWTTTGSTGGSSILVNVSVPASGFAVQMTGASGLQDALIYQTGYLDAYGAPILQPNTTYAVRFLAQKVSGTNGTLNFVINSASAGVLCSTSISIANLSLNLQWYTLNLGGTTPNSIPSDAVFQICLASSNAVVLLDEVIPYYSQNPYLTTARSSYVQNPEAFDGVTGTFGPDSDSSGIQSLSLVRNSLIFKTVNGMHFTQDSSGSEPSQWTFNEITRTVGSISFRGSDAGKFGTGDSGEEWDVTASRGGLYLYAGGEVIKISQEIQSDWETINWSAAKSLWIKNDSVTRRLFIGVPTGANTTPNQMFVMDYRYLESASQIAQGSCVRISYTGKMIATDMCRKWTRWTIPAISGEILLRGTNNTQMCVGTSSNAYYFDPNYLVDDDYGTIPWYYTTYAFVNGEAEQALGLGGHRKLYVYLASNIAGTGTFTVTPYANTLTNARQVKGPYPLTSNPDHDIETPLNVATERCFFKYSGSPNAGSNVSWASMTKMVVSAKPHPISVIRGAI